MKKKLSDKRRNIVEGALLPGQWQWNTAIFFLLMIATVILYSGDLQLGFFAVDDPGYITENPWIKSITAENIRHILGTPYFANYSPVHLFSYMLDYALAGQNAYAFHFSSNIWAGITAGFVFLVALAFTKNQIAAIFTAVLFIVHPVHVEAVAWISSRKDLVATAFALPSLLAYLKYRQSSLKKWYFLSLFLFTLAVAGKLSVATFPAVLFAWDIFVEKRPIWRSLASKLPFLGIALIIALAAASAQPTMGNHYDMHIIWMALVQNFWLLSGLATYVIYRVPPESGSTLLQFTGILFLLAAFGAPLLLRRRWPKITVLLYWILFAFLPSQVLSFTHPVADRYVFFPSAAAMILIGYGFTGLINKFKLQGIAVTAVLTVVLTFLWVKSALAYINEWRDPRSVWYGATSKSSDPLVYQNLGTYYLGYADQLNPTQPSTAIVSKDLKQFARAVWQEDTRLPKLLSKWQLNQRNGIEEIALQEHVRQFALQNLEQALKLKGNRIMPGLYYNRALILLKQGRSEEAKGEFNKTLDEAAKEPFAQVREQLTVYSHYDLGIIAWQQGDYPEALKWFRTAEDEQAQFEGNWLPDITKNRQRLEKIVASLPAK